MGVFRWEGGGGMWVQVVGGYVGSGGGGGGIVCSGGGCSGGGGGFSGGGEQRGKRLGDLMGAKGQTLGGGGVSSTESFCNLSLVLKRMRPGRKLALQSFRITHLINAEILAKFCTTR